MSSFVFQWSVSAQLHLQPVSCVFACGETSACCRHIPCALPRNTLQPLKMARLDQRGSYSMSTCPEALLHSVLAQSLPPSRHRQLLVDVLQPPQLETPARIHGAQSNNTMTVNEFIRQHPFCNLDMRWLQQPQRACQSTGGAAALIRWQHAPNLVRRGSAYRVVHLLNVC